jgi:alpha-L-rhamnosidase
MKPFRALTIIVLLLLTACQNNSTPDFKITSLKCEGLENPSGADLVPKFSWIVNSAARGEVQTAWQILVSSSIDQLKKDKGNLWDSKKTDSGKTTWISYNGSALKPGTIYFWKVRSWDRNGKPSVWSEASSFITGLPEKSDWKGAKWIGFEDISDSLLLVPGVHGSGDNLGPLAVKRTVVPYFRKEFRTERNVKQAIVFVSGLGQYEISINGKKIGDRFLSPGWTDYRKTCLYNTYDVSEDIIKGPNTLGVLVGNGFYNINRERYRKLVIAYGAPKVILRLTLKYSDGSEESVITDETWKTAPSPVTFSSIYGGEDYDARLEQPGWDQPGFRDAGWKQALAVKEPAGALRPENDYPVKVSEIIKVKKIYQKKDSIFTYDFGQNASGIVKIKVKGLRGQEVKLTPGELLDEDSLVTQKATGDPFLFTYTLRGGEEELWVPRFTYYGFRYLRLDGAVPAGYAEKPGKAIMHDIEFLHTRNSSPVTGSFRCSSELFNSIYTLINWSIKSNMASVATDCPHREKLGWLEQTHLMGNSVKFIYDIHNLFNKMIGDMEGAQLENGLVPDIAPEYVPFVEGFRDSPEWGSACVILPWDMYEWYGDLDAVKRAYPMMTKYVAYLHKKAQDNILYHGLGDWYDLGPKFPGEAQLTPKAVTATSIYYFDVRLLGRMAALTGQDDDAQKYEAMAEEIRKAFNSKFLDPHKYVYSTGSQTASSMPLFFGMADDSIKPKLVANLVRSINENNKALTAGDIGYRYLLRVLEQEGYSNLIFEMNSRNDVPGYGYQLSKGATSLTESWAALKYVSNDHMMLGHLMEWFYSGLGGIRQTALSGAYDTILIEPELAGDISWAETSYNSIHGEIATSWKRENDTLSLKVKIPVGCNAFVAIPQSDPSQITESGTALSQSAGISVKGKNKGKTICAIKSGEYLFKTRYTASPQ